MAPTPIEENPVPTGSIGTGTVFRVGTLSYTLPGLLFLMAWLLWGDFSINLMENVVPSVLPLKLRELQAPNWLIAFFLTAIPSILNATVCPIVSFWSDRHRGPLGRRIPFILYTIPFLCLSLILIGLVPSFVAFLHRSGISFDKNFLALVLIGIFTIAFQFFNMFVSSVYYYLFNDVVPHKFLGRFLAAFRCVAVLAGAAFYYVIFPKAETHFTEIFVGAAVLYGVVFTIMCLKVKEGKYPPPSAKGNDSKWESTKTFFKESYSHGFYWLFYLFAAFWATSTTINVFTIFFVRSVGISLEQFGSLSGTLGIVTAIPSCSHSLVCVDRHPFSFCPRADLSFLCRSAGQGISCLVCHIGSPSSFYCAVCGFRASCVYAHPAQGSIWSVWCFYGTFSFSGLPRGWSSGRCFH